MSNKHIQSLFEALTPTSEQKEKMFHRILLQSREINQRPRGVMPSRHLKTALSIATVWIGLSTTAFAAAYMGLDEAFLKFLKPANQDQMQFLSDGAYTVNERVVHENGTLTIKQVIGDGNLTYLLMDFAAPQGTVLDAARYRFEHPMITTDQQYVSTNFEVLDDENPHDNQISLIMSIMSQDPLAGQTAHFKFRDLQAAAPFPGIFETVIPGTWEADVSLNFKAYSTLYPVKRKLAMFGYEAVLQTISVSPISITLKIESESLKEIDQAAGRLKEIGDNEYLDHYPVTIKYQDGTSSTTSLFTGLALSDFLNGELLTIKTFEQVINEKDIASIVFFGQEIPFRHP